MKKLFTIFLFFISTTTFAQNVKLEITDYYKVFNGTEYCTYQFASASGSYSRSTLVLITDKNTLQSLSQFLLNIYKEKKQEFTDVWVLGFYNFNPNSFSETDLLIIQEFYSKILKYRKDNDLPLISLHQLEENKILIKSKEDICKTFSCSKFQNL